MRCLDLLAGEKRPAGGGETARDGCPDLLLHDLGRGCVACLPCAARAHQQRWALPHEHGVARRHGVQRRQQPPNKSKSARQQQHHQGSESEGNADMSAHDKRTRNQKQPDQPIYARETIPMLDSLVREVPECRKPGFGRSLVQHKRRRPTVSRAAMRILPLVASNAAVSARGGPSAAACTTLTVDLDSKLPFSRQCTGILNQRDIAAYVCPCPTESEHVSWTSRMVEVLGSAV